MNNIVKISIALLLLAGCKQQRNQHPISTSMEDEVDVDTAYVEDERTSPSSYAEKEKTDNKNQADSRKLTNEEWQNLMSRTYAAQGAAAAYVGSAEQKVVSPRMKKGSRWGSSSEDEEIADESQFRHLGDED